MSQTIEFWMKQTEIRETALKIAESKIAELEAEKKSIIIEPYIFIAGVYIFVLLSQSQTGCGAWH